MKRTEQKAILFILGIGQSLCYLFLFCVGNLRTQIIACEVGFFSAFLLYGVSLFLLRVLRSPAHKELDHDPSYCPFTGQRFCVITILCFSLLFRTIMWLSPPTLSDDIYRYLWEGKLTSLGINPFEYAPDDLALEHFRDAETYPNINHKELLTIYPPLNQFIFAASAYLHPTISTLNMTFILFDLFTIAILILTLRTLTMDLNRIVIYAWNPLVIMEFAGSGHLDSAGIFLLMLALYLCIQQRNFSPAFVLALSCLNKFLPGIFLPFVLRKKKLPGIGIFFLMVILCYIPFLSAGKKIFTSLRIYAEHWFFNASLYDIFVWMLCDTLIAKKICAALFLLLGIGLFVWFSRRMENERPLSLYRAGFTIMGAFLLLTPVVHPWYVCWIIPFLAIFPNRAWIFFSGAVFLSYWVLKEYAVTGVWKEQMTIKLLQYVPFYCLLLEDIRQRLLNGNLQLKAYL